MLYGFPSTKPLTQIHLRSYCTSFFATLVTRKFLMCVRPDLHGCHNSLTIHSAGYYSVVASYRMICIAISRKRRRLEFPRTTDLRI